MRTEADFSRVLDEKLGAAQFAWASPSDSSDTRSSRPFAHPVFLFGDLRNGFSAEPTAANRPKVSSGASPWTTVYAARPEAQPSRPARTLSLAQRQALDVLRSVGGATLADDFTDAELKSAFRALARRFHPDRHPESADGERARLARTFGRIAEAYRLLARLN
jgi:hypothetical protein